VIFRAFTRRPVFKLKLNNHVLKITGVVEDRPSDQRFPGAVNTDVNLNHARRSWFVIKGDGLASFARIDHTGRDQLWP